MIKVFNSLLRKKLALELVPSLNEFREITSWQRFTLLCHPARWSNEALPEFQVETQQQQAVFANDTVMIALTTSDSEPRSALLAVAIRTDYDPVALLCTASIPLPFEPMGERLLFSSMEAAIFDPNLGRLYQGGAPLEFVLELTEQTKRRWVERFVAKNNRPPSKEEELVMQHKLGVKTELDSDGYLNLKLNRWPAFLHWAYGSAIAPILPRLPLLLEACSAPSLPPKFDRLLK